MTLDALRRACRMRPWERLLAEHDWIVCCLASYLLAYTSTLLFLLVTQSASSESAWSTAFGYSLAPWMLIGVPSYVLLAEPLQRVAHARTRRFRVELLQRGLAPASDQVEDTLTEPDAPDWVILFQEDMPARRERRLARISVAGGEACMAHLQAAVESQPSLPELLSQRPADGLPRLKAAEERLPEDDCRRLVAFLNSLDAHRFADDTPPKARSSPARIVVLRRDPPERLEGWRSKGAVRPPAPDEGGASQLAHLVCQMVDAFGARRSTASREP